MRKSYLKKSLAVLLSAMMLPSLVACGNGSDDKASDSVESKSETSKESSESKTEESGESTDAENPGGGSEQGRMGN